MNKMDVAVSISYRCKHCSQLAVKPETTKENLMFPLWHDCANNVWHKSEKPEEKAEAA